MRKKKLALNTITSLGYQLTTIICAFILPRVILVHFGSQANGLVQSITEFLSIIAFLELGVGAVVQSSLYKPLSENNNTLISQIVVSANKFFKKLAYILLVYVIVLLFVYPSLIDSSYNYLYTGTLIAAMSISSFAQYYFGVVDRLLLTADQKGYVQYIAQIVIVLLNTVVCVSLINLGGTIQLVKLTTSLIYLLRPIILRTYVNKHYNINRKIKYEKEPIAQKWNGVAQHVAAVILTNTDTVVLTLFSTLENVSIYSVYHLVLNGIKNLFTSLTQGMQALLGELWARQEIDTLQRTFLEFEWCIHTGVVFVFGCTGVLIMPFVSVYTYGIIDVDYIVPVFSVVLTLAHAMHCLRLPYNVMILAAGHYRQTQSNYIVSSILNVVISILAVYRFGLVGVAIGTFIAMLYQTVWIAFYNSKNINKWPFSNFIKQILVDVLTVFIGVILIWNIRMPEINYLAWIILAIKVALIWMIVIICVNLIFYKGKIIKFANIIKNSITKGEK